MGDADDRRLDAGANLALVGDELVQFGQAEPLGERRWRLTRLLRGRRGTEAAIGTQAAGDRFALLEAGAARVLDLPVRMLGGTVRVMAAGVGDEEPVTASAAVTGASVLPPAPAGLAAEWDPSGGLAMRWRRRSRLGWRWLDGGDVPLAEEREHYRVTLVGAAGETSRETEAPVLTMALGELPAELTAIAVRQRGTLGESAPATLILQGDA